MYFLSETTFILIMNVFEGFTLFEVSMVKSKRNCIEFPFLIDVLKNVSSRYLWPWLYKTTLTREAALEDKNTIDEDDNRKKLRRKEAKGDLESLQLLIPSLFQKRLKDELFLHDPQVFLQKCLLVTQIYPPTNLQFLNALALRPVRILIFLKT